MVSCGKTVYPVEKMNCAAANKTWHKGCFRCKKCNVQLNLKTYKVHDGDIWCNVHYPPATSEIKSFKQDKVADSGTIESEVSDSVADSGGSWGASTPDSGTVESTPQSYGEDAGAGGDEGYAEEGYAEEGY